MSEPKHPRDELSSADRALVAAVDREFRSEPRSPMQRAVFQHELEERLERHRPWRRVWGPALGATLVAASLAFVLRWGAIDQAMPETPLEGRGEFLLTIAMEDRELESFGDILPEDYAAIAAMIGLDQDEIEVREGAYP